MHRKVQQALDELQKVISGKEAVMQRILMAMLAGGHILIDDVPGVGPKRKRQIMRHFGSLKRLKAASEEEIAAVPGVPAEVANSVWQTLRAWNAEAAGVAEKAAKPE